MDSLNRHYLPAYGNKRVKTPNIDRLAEKSVTLNNHWLGSAPCMPARRDLLTGRLNFLERNWSGLEPYDIPFTRLLREAGIFSHMVTDHYHYFHPGGENYHAAFDTWEFIRGQENDRPVSRVRLPEEPEHLGRWSPHYELNRTEFKSAGDFPSSKTMNGAVKWLQQNKDADNYMLWVEAFDPHEPFDCPKKYVDLYNDTWDGISYNWSEYEEVDGNSEAIKHLQKQYAGTLTMLDERFGRLLDEIEKQNGFEDTMIILTADHSYMLSEHNCTGKNLFPVWNEMASIPLIIHLPGSRHAGGHREQITQNIDMMPTILDYFNVSFKHEIHGRSLKDILENNGPGNRQAALYGFYGKNVNVTDGEYTYFRASANKENQPLYSYFQMPGTYAYHDIKGEELYRDAELGNFLPHVAGKVIRARNKVELTEYIKDTHLYNILSDPAQKKNLANTDIEKKYIELIKRTMKEMDSPPEQYERMGLNE